MSECCSSSTEISSCCCGTAPTPASVTLTISFQERFDDLLCRFSNRKRMNHRVTPGLYALGKPSPESPVLVTANYRMSFNQLRLSMTGWNAWILVLDTKGINVWCAAGKGTFGTQELIKRISDVKLASVVSHRRVIVPQLGASGVSAYQVTKETGFGVSYGPVRAADVPAYLSNNNTATADMRRVNFNLLDRQVLVPMETIPALKKLAIFLIVAAVFFGATRTGILYQNALNGIFPLIIGGLTAVLTGSILVPALLPLLPGKSFAIKGFVAGLAGLAGILGIKPVLDGNFLLIGLCTVAIPAWSSYLAIIFTGCTTYTSPSGVKAELKIALPIYIGAVVVSFVLLILYLLQFRGIV